MNSQIEQLLEQIDGTDADYKTLKELRSLISELEVTTLLLKRFRSARSCNVRRSCVYFAINYARKSEDAVQLGLEAIRDRSKVVRYRGAMLLAYSLRKDTIVHLENALQSLNGGPGSDDILAAIDAIKNNNHHYFIDRDHSGNMRLIINEEDDED